MAGLRLGTTVRRGQTGDGSGERPRLVLLWVFPEIKLTPLDARRTVLGRDPVSDVVLAGEQTSRQHVELRRSGLVVTARDLGSTNGLLLNGAQVTEAGLKPHDVLRVGDWIGVVADLTVKDAPDADLFQEVIPGYWGGPALLARLEPAQRAARADLPIVVQGETGAGKEGVARAVHAWSQRKGPFLALNCAALPESLAEGELFGYRRGAFTGADRAHAGYLRAATGGTLFLDEIVDLPLAVQAKLLRALEQREVTPLGESAPQRIDVRIICASQGPLARAADEGRFRPDLYARLDGLTVELPPLRQRNEEAVFLFERLLRQHGKGGTPIAFDASFAEQLCLYDWPFNVRELDLLARQLMALHADERMLKRTHLPERFRQRSSRALTPAPTDPPRRRGDGPDIETFANALRANRGNVKHAAAALGISRAKAYRLMEAATDSGATITRR